MSTSFQNVYLRGTFKLNLSFKSAIFQYGNQRGNFKIYASSKFDLALPNMATYAVHLNLMYL